MKKITSFTKFTTGEGDRICFSYSEIDEKGRLITQNKRVNFILMDPEIKELIKTIENYIEEEILKEET